ncbi:MAG: hypothetical protein ACFBSC_09800 [Microcoleaceae cyanobacterium]
MLGTSESSESPSRLAAFSQGNKSERAGSVRVNTNQLLVQDGARITVNSAQEAAAGSLEITANDIFINFGEINAETEAGQGGRLTLTVQDTLELQNQSVVSASTVDGQGGILNVVADDILLQDSSRIISAVTGSGIAGTLNVDASQLDMAGESDISVSSEAGAGAAGNLNLTSPSIYLDQSAIEANTAAGQDANIAIQATEIELRNQSQIETDAREAATGGNILIETATLVALENSDISANAQQAAGGFIRIDAEGIFGTEFQEQTTPNSDITATSELGSEFSGVVELDAEIAPAQGLVEFSQEVIDPNALVAQDVCRQSRGSEFVIVGRGGIPQDPTEQQDDSSIQVNMVEPSSTTSSPNLTRNSAQDQTRHSPPEQLSLSSTAVIPARGWIRQANGEVILVGYDPTQVAQRRQPYQGHHCQTGAGSN